MTAGVEGSVGKTELFFKTKVPENIFKIKVSKYNFKVRVPKKFPKTVELIYSKIQKTS
jgi:hypothetical protein